MDEKIKEAVGTVKLERHLGTTEITAISFGLVICIATWSLDAYAFAIYGMSFGITVAIAGIVYIILAMHFGELASMFPTAASIRTWAEKSFGSFGGIAAPLIYILPFVIGPGAEALTGGMVLNTFIPGFRWEVFTLIVCGASLLLNLLGIRVVGIFSNILLIYVVVVAAAFGLSGIFGLSLHTSPDFSLFNDPFKLGLTGMATGFLAAMWLYAGFEVACPLAQECKNPRKDLARGMIIAVITIMILKILFGVGVYLNIPGDILSDFIFMKEIGDMFFGPIGIGLIFLFAIACTSTNAITAYASVSRVIYGMAQKPNMVPRKWMWLHPKFKTPWVGLFLIFTGQMSLIFYFGRYIPVLMALVSSFIWVLEYIVVVFCVISIRNKYPELERPYKMPIGPYKLPFLSIVALAIMGSFMYLSCVPPYGDPRVFWYGMLFTLLVLVYALIWWMNRRHEIDSAITEDRFKHLGGKNNGN